MGVPQEGRGEWRASRMSCGGLTRRLVAHPEPPHAVGCTRNSRLNGSRIQAGKRTSDKRYTKQSCHSRLLKQCIVLSYNTHGEGLPDTYTGMAEGSVETRQLPICARNYVTTVCGVVVMFSRPVSVLSAVTTLFSSARRLTGLLLWADWLISRAGKSNPQRTIKPPRAFGLAKAHRFTNAPPSLAQDSRSHQRAWWI